MPAYLNEEGIDIPVNKELSELDKAFIMLNYPPNLKTPEKLKDFIQAMIDAGVTDKAAGEILKAFNTPSPQNFVEDSDDDLAYRFGNMRECFSEYNKRTTQLRSGRWHEMDKAIGSDLRPRSERPTTECHRSRVLGAVRYQGLPRRRDKQQAFPEHCQEHCQEYSVATRDSAEAVSSWSVAA